MNIDEIKKDIEKNINNKVKVIVFGMRNKKDYLIGTINQVYPNIFTVLVNEENKSFRYADILTGEIQVKYL